MSSFLVSKDTIDNIVTGLTSKQWTNSLMFCYPFEYYIKEDEDFNKLGRELLKLNYNALAIAYNYKIDNKEIKKYKFNFKDSSLIQFLKNLDCFLYQCNEGKNNKKKLYKDLKKIQSALKNKVIFELEDYKNSKWGF